MLNAVSSQKHRIGGSKTIQKRISCRLLAKLIDLILRPEAAKVGHTGGSSAYFAPHVVIGECLKCPNVPVR